MQYKKKWIINPLVNEKGVLLMINSLHYLWGIARTPLDFSLLSLQQKPLTFPWQVSRNEMHQTEEAQFMGLPSPFEELSVGSSVHEAVLLVRSERAGFIAVVRFFRIRSPISKKICCISLFLWSPTYWHISWKMIDLRFWWEEEGAR